MAGRRSRQHINSIKSGPPLVDKWVARENAARAMQTIASYHCLETPFRTNGLLSSTPNPPLPIPTTSGKNQAFFWGGGKWSTTLKVVSLNITRFPYFILDKNSVTAAVCGTSLYRTTSGQVQINTIQRRNEEWAGPRVGAGHPIQIQYLH